MRQLSPLTASKHELKMALRTQSISVVRGRPPGLAVGIRGSSNSHCSAIPVRDSVLTD